MKTLSKVAIALVIAAGLTACGGESGISGATGDIVIKPGCMILCGE